MLNFLRPFFARLFGPLIQALARTPVTPNMITVAGTVGVCAAALSMFPIGETFPGAATATVFVFTDMLDGQLARIKGDSGKFGAFLDSTMDRFADASVFGGITIWFMRTDHLLAVVSLFCLASGLCVSYVKARAEGLGLNADVGLIERPERLLIGLTGIGLSGLGVPYVMAIGMWTVALGSAYTLYQRIRAVYIDARSQAAQSAAGQPAAAESGAPRFAAGRSPAAESAAGQPATRQSTAQHPAAARSAVAEPTAGEQPPAGPSPAAEPAPAQSEEA
jgi:CDP-diacylglycerol--glycerol-3-phosphate 3-phosphatidyltransferase